MIVNISDQNKAFFWSPPKTASNLASMIFDNYHFYAYDIIKKEKVSERVKFFHSNSFFENHEKYDFILTVRNPYNQFISKFGYDKCSYEKLTELLENEFLVSSHNFNTMKNLIIRKPDYIIRVEEIENDYLKIPFIKDSEFHLSGGLKKLIDSKPNQYNDIKNSKILKQDLADLIYFNNLPIFEICGYERDSWKY